MSLDVSPDGRHLAFDLLGHIYEMPIDGGEATALTTGRSWNMFPRYSPDGMRLAFSSDRGGSEDMWILHRGTDSLENISDMPLPVVQGTWSADGRALYGSVTGEDGGTTAYRFNLFGTRQEIASGTTFQPMTHFAEHTGRKVLFFEHLDQQLHGSGARIKTYDLETGEIEPYRERPGGAFNPTLSPDGRYLAYGHRDDQETVVVLHDLETRSERILVRGLDRDHQEYGPYYYGVAPNMAWHPDGDRLYLAFGGAITAVDVASGASRDVPFRAPVDRRLDATVRFPYDFPDDEARAATYRWAHRTSAGILFESLRRHLVEDRHRPGQSHRFAGARNQPGPRRRSRNPLLRHVDRCNPWPDPSAAVAWRPRHRGDRHPEPVRLPRALSRRGACVRTGDRCVGERDAPGE